MLVNQNQVIHRRIPINKGTVRRYILYEINCIKHIYILVHIKTISKSSMNNIFDYNLFLEENL